MRHLVWGRDLAGVISDGSYGEGLCQTIWVGPVESQGPSHRRSESAVGERGAVCPKDRGNGHGPSDAGGGHHKLKRERKWTLPSKSPAGASPADTLPAINPVRPVLDSGSL